MELKREIDRIFSEIADLSCQLTHGKTVDELIEELILEVEKEMKN